jgi:hypothetical protein
LGQPGDVDDVGIAASFNGPSALLLDGDALLVADTNNNLIRRVALEDASVTTVAGTRGSIGVLEEELPGSLFEPLGLARAHDGGLLVPFQTGVLLIE